MGLQVSFGEGRVCDFSLKVSGLGSRLRGFRLRASGVMAG